MVTIILRGVLFSYEKLLKLDEFQTKLTETKGGWLLWEQHEPEDQCSALYGRYRSWGSAYGKRPPVVEVNEWLALPEKLKKEV